MKLGEPLLGRQGQGLSARWGGNVLKSFPPCFGGLRVSFFPCESV